MIKIVVIILLLFMPSTSLCDEWTTEDTVWEVASLSALFVDYFQTIEISRNPNYVEKTNTVIGKYPSESEINVYFATYVVGHALVSWLLPNKYELFGVQTYPRKTWQLFWFGMEANAVINNYRIGIRF